MTSQKVLQLCPVSHGSPTEVKFLTLDDELVYVIVFAHSRRIELRNASTACSKPTACLQLDSSQYGDLRGCVLECGDALQEIFMKVFYNQHLFLVYHQLWSKLYNSIFKYNEALSGIGALVYFHTL